jgi:hypothetical protein
MEQLIIEYQSFFGNSITKFDLFDFFFHGCKRLQKKRKKC